MANTGLSIVERHQTKAKVKVVDPKTGEVTFRKRGGSAGGYEDKFHVHIDEKGIDNAREDGADIIGPREFRKATAHISGLVRTGETATALHEGPYVHGHSNDNLAERTDFVVVPGIGLDGDENWGHSELVPYDPSPEGNDAYVLGAFAAAYFGDRNDSTLPSMAAKGEAMFGAIYNGIMAGRPTSEDEVRDNLEALSSVTSHGPIVDPVTAVMRGVIDLQAITDSGVVEIDEDAWAKTRSWPMGGILVGEVDYGKGEVVYTSLGMREGCDFEEGYKFSDLERIRDTFAEHADLR